MDIESLTLAQIRTIQALMLGSSSPKQAASHPYVIGSSVFVRTVTMNFTGRLVAVYETELVLEDAAWIADSGRFSVALATGVLNEVEPYPPGYVVVSRPAICDVSIWAHPLPRAVK